MALVSIGKAQGESPAGCCERGWLRFPAGNAACAAGMRCLHSNFTPIFDQPLRSLLQSHGNSQF
ncbi:MAG: hypothetical protein EAZ36_01530 [Verrucomicrobia bacterium]|nr:MAG: hypothetical protein EAZ36_01530 [Verrucomicrobiota bacterium]